MKLEEETLAGIVAAILRAAANCCHVVLYGSAARHEMTMNSDIDLLIVIRGRTTSGHTDLLRSVLTSKFHYQFDLVVVSEADYQSRRLLKSDIVETAVETGRVVYSGN
jgi:predicted nucleotidyltransferase